MEQRIKDIWYNYKSEVLFGVVLLVLTALSHWMARFIPVALFDGVITAVQNACTIAVCLFGAVLMFMHSEGIRIRKAWGWVLLVWGLADAFFLVQTYFLHMPVLNIGDEAMSAFQLLVANLLAWLLLVYPQEVIRPNWLTFSKAMWQPCPCVHAAVVTVAPVRLQHRADPLPSRPVETVAEHGRRGTRRTGSGQCDVSCCVGSLARKGETLLQSGFPIDGFASDIAA